jgi:hypothetical protein
MSDGLVLAIALVAVAGAWYRNRQAYERVLLVSKEVCADLHLQRLDDSVALRRVQVSRSDGRLALVRTYSFEFSTTGADRHRAVITLVGLALHSVRVDHPDGAIIIPIEDRAES